MSKYLLEMPHTMEQCMEALDETAANPILLDQIWWGCMAGNHTAWAMVEAGSQTEALNMVPAVVRPQAVVTEIQQFSEQQIRDMHKKAA